MEIISKTTEDTKKLAREIAAHIKPGQVVALYGDLGSGKTTLTGFIVAELGFKSRVQSPTFVIMRKYKKDSGKIKVINHIDLYRISNLAEIIDLGLAETFVEKETISIIEWPELAETLLPENTVRIKFTHLESDERQVYVENLY